MVSETIQTFGFVKKEKGKRKKIEFQSIKIDRKNITSALKDLSKLFEVEELTKIEATLSTDEKGNVGFSLSIPNIIGLEAGVSQSWTTGLKFVLEKKTGSGSS